MSTGRNYLKSAIVILAMLSSTTALARWQGTWDTSYGRITLKQAGTHVYGDYGNWGTIEGVTNQDKTQLRGVYRRNDDGTYGYFEWKLSNGVSFTGRWQNDRQPVPKYNSRGTPWKGKRQSGNDPTLSVYKGSGNIGLFMGEQDIKYKYWIRDLYEKKAAAPAAPKGPTVNPLAKRFPKMRDYQPNWKPAWFEVSLNSLVAKEKNAEIYGLIGIYAYCVTANGSRPLRSFGNAKARVFDQPRNRTVVTVGRFGLSYIFGSSAKRKFPIDAECLKDSTARFKIQIQTNLKEKDTVRRTDDVFGYRAFDFELEKMPSSKGKMGFSSLGDSSSTKLLPRKGVSAPFELELDGAAGDLNTEEMLIKGSVAFVK